MRTQCGPRREHAPVPITGAAGRCGGRGAHWACTRVERDARRGWAAESFPVTTRHYGVISVGGGPAHGVAHGRGGEQRCEGWRCERERRKRPTATRGARPRTLERAEPVSRDVLSTSVSGNDTEGRSPEAAGKMSVASVVKYHASLVAWSAEAPASTSEAPGGDLCRLT